MIKVNCDNLERVYLGGTGRMYLTNIEGKDYLFKPGINKSGTSVEPFRADVQKVGYEVQKIVDEQTAVEVFTGSLNLPFKLAKTYDGPLYGSFQPRLDNQSGFRGKLTRWQYSSNAEMGADINNQLLRESVTDYLLYNFDQNGANFILDSHNKVRGIDKEQSLKHVLENDSFIDLDYNPNVGYGSAEPVLHTLIKKFMDGTDYAYLPTVYPYISKVESISDEEYMDIFQPYLCSIQKSFNFSDADIKKMARKILSRKHNIRYVFSEVFIDAIKKRGSITYGENKALTQMLDVISNEMGKMFIKR